MQIKKLHKWNLSYSQAVELQKTLACEVQFTPIRRTPALIAGLDCAFSKDGKRIIAAVVVLKASDFELIETKNSIKYVNDEVTSLKVEVAKLHESISTIKDEIKESNRRSMWKASLISSIIVAVITVIANIIAGLIH